MKGGSFHLLGAQIAAIVAVGGWSALTSYLSLKAIAHAVPSIRIDLADEVTGLDMTLNKINTDADWDKILSPHPDPTKPKTAAAAASKASSRRKLAKVINAIMAVNRLMAASKTGGRRRSAGGDESGGGEGGDKNLGATSISKFGHQLKAYNTKVLAQSWSSVVRPSEGEDRSRPLYTEPHS